MQHVLHGRTRVVGAVIVAAVLGLGAYAFTATNTVPATSAGSGSGTISGYTISNVQYQLNSTTPTNIDSLTFTLSANATTAKAKVVSGSSTYTDCTIAGGVNVTLRLQPGRDRRLGRPAVGHRDVLGAAMAAGRESVMARPAGRAAGPPRRGVQVLGGVAGLLCVLVAWLYLAPAQIGGATSYAVVFGSSMEPKLGADDLVLVRPQARYAAGDVVLYDDPQLRFEGAPPHRACRRRTLRPQGRQQRLSRQFPANGATQIVGALWVTAPGVGRVTTWLREPINAGLLVGLATLVALGGGVAAGSAVSGRRRRLPSRGTAAGAPDAEAPLDDCSRSPAWPSRSSPWSPSPAQRPVSSRPSSRGPTRARFAYRRTFRAARSIRTGACRRASPCSSASCPACGSTRSTGSRREEPASVDGTIGMTARLSDGRGWARVLQVAPEQEFTGAVARIDGVVDLDARAAPDGAAAGADRHEPGGVLADARARVTTTGEVDGRPLESTFSPAVALELADLRLQPQLDDDGSFVRRETGMGTVAVPRVDPARPGAALGRPTHGGSARSRLPSRFSPERPRLPRSAAAALRDEPARIAARHGRMLVDVGSHAVDPRRVHDLPDIDALARSRFTRDG